MKLPGWMHNLLHNRTETESIALRQAARNEAVTSLLARCPVGDSSIDAHRQPFPNSWPCS